MDRKTQLVGLPGSHPAASPWVARYLAGVAKGGRVLDVACGGGRNTRLALAQGLAVTAIDRELAGVSDLAGRPDVELIDADLENGTPFPVAGRRFDGVIVTNYLWRPLLPYIVAAVAPCGVLIYETFAAGNERYGKPSNPEFLLRPGELLDAVRGLLTPIAFEHVTRPPPVPRIIQRIAAAGPAHPWLEDPPFESRFT